jgi:protein-disulfide isomerase
MFGARSWEDFARDAGVPDLKAFTRCAAGTKPIFRVEEGVRLAKEFGLGGTPTVIVNGWKFVGGPPEKILSDAIDRLLEGKPPRNARNSDAAM